MGVNFYLVGSDKACSFLDTSSTRTTFWIFSLHLDFFPTWEDEEQNIYG